MKKYDVIVIGELNVDAILNRINGLPQLGKEILAETFTMTLGSSSSIFASNLSTLGAKVGFLGKMGTDSFADLIKAALQERGVDTSPIIQSQAVKTGITLVLNYDQDRAMVTYPGAMEHFGVDEVLPSVLEAGRHMHVSSVFLQPTLKKDIVLLFKKAKEAGLTTSLDPQWDPSETWDLPLTELLPYVDVFLPNQVEFQRLTHTHAVEEGIEKIASVAHIMAVKQGDKGAYLWDKKQLIFGKAFFNPEVADCIGAGDSFDAGFISRYVKGISPEQCLAFANLTGAINTTSHGGTSAFSSWEAVKEIAKTKFSYTIPPYD